MGSRNGKVCRGQLKCRASPHTTTLPSPPNCTPRLQTTFIKYLLGRDYPGSHIGPEPTTDRFVVVYHGLEERRIPGNTLAVQKDLPYQGLAGFGTGFLSR